VIIDHCERGIPLKWHNQSNSAASRANKMLGLIKNSFKTRDPLALKKLYCGLVRPLLDYAAPVWSPYSVGDKKILEKVQRRATKLPRICRDLQYNERLKLLNLQSLDDRITRGDLIQVFKCMNGLDEVNWMRPLQFKTSAKYCIVDQQSTREAIKKE
jgi:ribonucleases P/MRP protein subunit RPP40